MRFQLLRTVSSYWLDVEYTAYYILRYFFFMDRVKWEIAGTIMEQIMRPLDSFAYDMIVCICIVSVSNSTIRYFVINSFKDRHFLSILPISLEILKSCYLYIFLKQSSRILLNLPETIRRRRKSDEMKRARRWNAQQKITRYLECKLSSCISSIPMYSLYLRYIVW